MLYKTDAFDATKEKGVIIDTNVILYLFAAVTPKDTKFASKYARVFQNIIDNGLKIVITDVQISELINVLLKKGHTEYKKLISDNSITYKDYRKTENCEILLLEIQNIIKSLLTISKLDSFCLDEESLLSFFEQSKLDYNDIYLVQYAKKNDMPIITNDKDFLHIDYVRIYSEM